MSVNPGFGGQKFIPATLAKAMQARAKLDAYEQQSGRRIRLEIDGGVNVGNIAEIARAGVDSFVAGSAVFGAGKESDPHRYDSVLAALRGGIKTVLIPQDNVKDLQEIPDNVKTGLEIVPVRWIDKVLELALEHAPVPLTDEEVAAAAVAAAEKTAHKSGADAVKH